ncbi:serine hydrolase domain-containing protein [Kytococcus aerolatus]|uniref:serine hydrolase domain-containing protein n=1 Tax=Kytococcus aerolatus TaxID=592308 RepID=UPI00135C0183|nr:serine hydrolase domain-containing protein [Kytococcus aerolatus]
MTGAVSIGYFDAEHDTTTQYGHVDIENGVRADERSVYEWGSTTKLLVWVAIMQLEDQGRLDRSDQVSDHLEGTGLTFEKSFTLQDLMDHRAGFAEIAYPPETTDPPGLPDLRPSAPAGHRRVPRPLRRPGHPHRALLGQHPLRGDPDRPELQRVRPSTWLTIVLVISLANVLYWRWILA